ncbi:conserved hypothetical protein [Pantoea brenneri]|uniref:Uncharacterized protein n=1 Tax=Pantoea brenneri TaxID=472694 RepID=A0AAX3J8T7_9GAMM|nr:conserved hypothetical protein [Pantoea brenneri]
MVKKRDIKNKNTLTNAASVATVTTAFEIVAGIEYHSKYDTPAPLRKAAPVSTPAIAAKPQINFAIYSLSYRCC